MEARSKHSRRHHTCRLREHEVDPRQYLYHLSRRGWCALSVPGSIQCAGTELTDCGLVGGQVMIVDHDRKTVEHAMQSLAGLNKADLTKDVNEVCSTWPHTTLSLWFMHVQRVLLVKVMVHSLLRPMPRTDNIKFAPKVGWLWGEKRETVRKCSLSTELIGCPSHR